MTILRLSDEVMHAYQIKITHTTTHGIVHTIEERKVMVGRSVQEELMISN